MPSITYEEFKNNRIGNCVKRLEKMGYIVEENGYYNTIDISLELFGKDVYVQVELKDFDNEYCVEFIVYKMNQIISNQYKELTRL